MYRTSLYFSPLIFQTKILKRLLQNNSDMFYLYFSNTTKGRYNLYQYSVCYPLSCNSVGIPTYLFRVHLISLTSLAYSLFFLTSPPPPYGLYPQSSSNWQANANILKRGGNWVGRILFFFRLAEREGRICSHNNIFGSGTPMKLGSSIMPVLQQVY